MPLIPVVHDVSRYIWSYSQIVLASGCSLLLALKLVEMTVQTCWLRQLPRMRSSAVLAAIEAWRKVDVADELDTDRQKLVRLWSPRKWPFSGVLMRRGIGLAVRQFILRKIFRWPYLMCFQAFVVVANTNRTLLIIGTALLLLGVWIEIFQRLMFRLRLGYVDSYLRRVGILQLYKPHSALATLAPPNEIDMLEDFLKLFSRLAAVVVVSYAAAYAGLNVLCQPVMVFHGVCPGWRGNVGLIYFSVATMATVGYGDIYPEGALAQLVVVSQILAGFSLIVMLLTAFSLSSPEVEGREPQ
jgi:hypothetical protein